MAKPLTTLGIGVDALPASIKNSTVLTGNNLGRLANVETLPSDSEVQEFLSSGRIQELSNEFNLSDGELIIQAHSIAKQLLDAERVDDAWMILLLNEKQK